MALTLFEYLGIAGQERMHTQTLAWLLTPHCSPLNAANRVALLSSLGAPCTEAQADSLRVQTELDSLDLVCATESFCLVVENKLKSRQSYQQLEGYDRKIYAARCLLTGVQEFNAREPAPYKVFLTFAKERSGNSWTDVDYSQLLPALQSAADSVPGNPYIKDYANLVQRLVEARDAFVANPSAYPWVLERVSASAKERLSTPLPANGVTQHEYFICENRLERIFLQALLRTLTADVCNVIVDSGARGKPLVQLHLFLVQLRSGSWYQAGLQLQGAALKLTLAHIDYEHSKVSNNLRVFDACFQTGTPLRKAKGGNSRDYRSWVIAASADLRFTERPDVFAAAYKREVQAATNAWAEAIKNMRSCGEVLAAEVWSRQRFIVLRDGVVDGVSFRTA
ncbi:PD-(D/E)XK nuclease family protein [Aquincola sp. J276]|uniref:PD-(D/E)XK nuclease family protein n=1 Tax=Aquincola sp. J276 TaxID=2898432 RepID=UPI002151C57C|nr:PD-(D/E)XK nuclease family protein [Aquincola sp. J276]MCR5865671.1 PD-(D/E)XK nuclease family protein [Aquincola sp. J276]